jgi:sulfite exporter TauE/SafE
MNAGLALAGLALGAATMPHCALMCGSPCAALTGGRRGAGAWFLAGRAAGYMMAGALVAGGVAMLGAWARTSPRLQPLWTLVQLAFLALGLWWLATGRTPARLLRDGAVPVHVVPRRRHSLRAALGGLAWVAWPCGALQGALLLAALADGAAGGALVMGVFALASSPGLLAAPWLWSWWQRRSGSPSASARLQAFGYRCAGLGLALTSAWALAASLHERLGAICIT